MNERVAYLCPGQGAQHVGMGSEIAQEFPQARAAFAEADEVLGFSLSKLCAEGPENELTATENAQPALLAASVAVGRVLEAEAGFVPVIAAGHSLGEWSALVLAGAVDFATAVSAVRERGLLMRDAVPAGRGGMTALLGVEPDVAKELCEEASQGDASLVVPANLNGGKQIVLAGHLDALDRAEALAADRKLRASRLKVSAPFHSPLMAPARARFEKTLAEIEFQSTEVPVVSNVTAQAVGEGCTWAALLAEQITTAVRWEECARVVIEAAPAAIEVGAGKVLSGLMRRIERGYPCAASNSLSDLRKILADGVGGRA